MPRQIYQSMAIALVLLCSTLTAHATAPRFAPEWFQPAEDNPAVIIAHDYPPYRSATPETHGMHVQIVQAALAAVDLALAVDIQAAKSLVVYALLQENALAVIGENFNFQDSARQHLIFIPIHFRIGQYLFYEPSHSQDISWSGRPADLRGYRIGMESGDHSEDCQNAGLTCLRANIHDLFTQLTAGQLDLICIANARQIWFVNNYRPTDRMRIHALSPPAWQAPSWIVFNARHPSGQATSRQFKRGLRQLLDNGGYRRILETYIPDQAHVQMAIKQLQRHLVVEK